MFVVVLGSPNMPLGIPYVVAQLGLTLLNGGQELCNDSQVCAVKLVLSALSTCSGADIVDLQDQPAGCQNILVHA